MIVMRLVIELRVLKECGEELDVAIDNELGIID